MIFLGTAFCSDGNSLFPPTVKNDKLIAIQLFDGTYNHLYLSTNTDMTVKDLDEPWTDDTKMNANFDGDFDASNSSFSVRNTDHMVIRRREYGTMDWTVIHVQKVETVEDLNIHIIDKYARSGIEYEYSVASFANGIENENSFINNTVYSEFEGAYITDMDCIYGTIYNVDGCDTTRNVTGQVVEMLNSKYMNVVSNSATNCDSGSITGAFFEIDGDNLVDREASLQSRNEVKNRLANKKPLILKVDDGRIWMIKVSGEVSDAMDGHRDLRNISFSWVEVGDVNDMRTLYLNGLSDVDSRWW